MSNTPREPASGIGMLGGAFDPIHDGHVQCARDAVAAFNLSQCLLMPCADPVHKPACIASPEQRMTMAKRAVTPFPELSVSDMEITRTEPSYSLYTVQALRKAHPQESVGLILGTDALAGFTSWYHWQDILKYVHIFVAERPGFPGIEKSLHSDLAPLLATVAEMESEFAGRIIPFACSSSEVSSSDIRQRLAGDDGVCEHMSPSAMEYVLEHRIYSS